VLENHFSNQARKRPTPTPTPSDDWGQPKAQVGSLTKEDGGRKNSPNVLYKKSAEMYEPNLAKHNQRLNSALKKTESALNTKQKKNVGCKKAHLVSDAILTSGTQSHERCAS
jgi:hypothetical protein